MSEKTESVKELIESLTPSELLSLASYFRSKLPRHELEQKWGIGYETVLTAIYRSQDIVQRGVRGVVAEAVFLEKVVPTIKGWDNLPVIGDLPYDFMLREQGRNRTVKIQVKLQRTRKGEPDVMPSVYSGITYKVEVQKTRSGKKRKQGRDAPSASSETESNNTVQTRPYQFGDFDILAVSMQPSTRDWTRFMYTVGSWLIPRSKADEKHLIMIMQPVSPSPTDVWTDSIDECIRWLLSGERRLVFDLEGARQRKVEAREAIKQDKTAERKAAKEKRSAERNAKIATRKGKT
jgi:hypothetical protein